MIVDCHVHFVGDGSSGSGCWLNLHSPWRKLTGIMLVRSAGLPARLIRGGLDLAYTGQLLRWIRRSSLDRVVLLAQDEPYGDDGRKLANVATFYVPNDCVLDLARRHEEFIPAVSIHPGRPDAMPELDRCLAAGARVLKLLPNCHNVDCTAPKFREFWKTMAQGRMILLAHTGGEATLPVLKPEYENPEFLRGALDCGVTCIAAHAAGRNSPFGAHYTPRLIRLMGEYPHLYADNSALTTLNRYDTLPDLLPPSVQARVLHGSDYPVPIVPWGPWLGGHYDRETRDHLRTIESPLERDFQSKRMIGFGDDTFTRLGRLLGLE